MLGDHVLLRTSLAHEQVHEHCKSRMAAVLIGGPIPVVCFAESYDTCSFEDGTTKYGVSAKTDAGAAFG